MILDRKISWIAASLMGFAVVGCSPAADNQAAAPAPVTTTDSNVAAPVTSSATSVPKDARSLALNVQGAAPVGVTVRVKNIELGTDATVLDVSASYGGTITNDIALAGSQTYLLDEQGNRLMLKPPQDNQNLRITKGQTMDGKLVFLGAVPAGAKSVKLVFNDNNDGTSIIDPGLTIPLMLDGAAK